MVFAKHRVFGACIVGALLVAGCSSGGAHAESPVEVPNVLRQTQARATQELAARHLVVKVSGAFGIGRRVGRVVGESPAAGGSVPKGSTVRITVLYPSPGGGSGPVNVAANLGPCPETYPRTPLTTLNGGVAGLDAGVAGS